MNRAVIITHILEIPKEVTRRSGKIKQLYWYDNFNINEFCQVFNMLSEDFGHSPILTTVEVYSDGNFRIVLNK